MAFLIRLDWMRITSILSYELVNRFYDIFKQWFFFSTFKFTIRKFRIIITFPFLLFIIKYAILINPIPNFILFNTHHFFSHCFILIKNFKHILYISKPNFLYFPSHLFFIFFLFNSWLLLTTKRVIIFFNPWTCKLPIFLFLFLNVLDLFLSLLLINQ